jgi:hypothetical protein
VSSSQLTDLDRVRSFGGYNNLTCRPATLSGSSGEEADAAHPGAKKFSIADTACVRQCSEPTAAGAGAYRSVIGEQRHSKLVVATDADNRGT